MKRRLFSARPAGFYLLAIMLLGAGFAAPPLYGQTTLTNDTHPEGRTMLLGGVSAQSTNGGAVVFDGQTIVYTPPVDFEGLDTFTYTNRDCAGLEATGTVLLQVLQPGEGFNRVGISSGLNPLGETVVSLRYLGIPGYTYTLQRATGLGGALWSDLFTNTANLNPPLWANCSFRTPILPPRRSTAPKARLEPQAAAPGGANVVALYSKIITTASADSADSLRDASMF